jgi:hypothetical protein
MFAHQGIIPVQLNYPYFSGFLHLNWRSLSFFFDRSYNLTCLSCIGLRGQDSLDIDGLEKPLALVRNLIQFLLLLQVLTL